jgi:hypothetical protein
MRKKLLFQLPLMRVVSINQIEIKQGTYFIYGHDFRSK